jgi:hypothetical protein
MRSCGTALGHVRGDHREKKRENATYKSQNVCDVVNKPRWPKLVRLCPTGRSSEENWSKGRDASVRKRVGKRDRDRDIRVEMRKAAPRTPEAFVRRRRRDDNLDLGESFLSKPYLPWKWCAAVLLMLRWKKSCEIQWRT